MQEVPAPCWPRCRHSPSRSASPPACCSAAFVGSPRFGWSTCPRRLPRLDDPGIARLTNPGYRNAIYCMPLTRDAPLDRRLLRDDVYERLRDAIVAGTLAPG